MSLNLMNELPGILTDALDLAMKEGQTERLNLAKSIEAKLSKVENDGGIWRLLAKLAKSLLPKAEKNEESKPDEIIPQAKKTDTNLRPPIKNVLSQNNEIKSLKTTAHDFILAACNHFNVKPDNTLPIMMAICELESQFNPNAVNKKSNATGYYQFITKSGKDYLAKVFPQLPNKMNELLDPKVNTFCALKLLLDNAKSLGIDLNRPMNDNELKLTAIKLYAAHNSGSGNVAAIMQALNGNNKLMNQKAERYPWLVGRERYIQKVGALAVRYRNNPIS